MPLRVGWEEWAALPDLGIAAIRAKIDTGAQTSSLHAFSIYPFEADGRDMVRFGLHPLPERPDIELYCEADLVGQREITSSNGETELRYVISTDLKLGDSRWPIEISLANRETMAYRMLLGRKALENDVLVDVTQSCIQGTPDLTVYDSIAHIRPAEKPLSVALLTGAPESPSVERLVEAAEARGHHTYMLDIKSCYVTLTGGSLDFYVAGKPLPRFDMVMPYFSMADLTYGLAIVRQFEAAGIRCLNSSAALAASWDKLHAFQRLARRGVALPMTGFANAPGSDHHLIRLLGGAPLNLRIFEAGQDRGSVTTDTKAAAESVLRALHSLDTHVLVQNYVPGAQDEVIRCLVIGRKVESALRLIPAHSESVKPEAKRAQKLRLKKEERRMAIKAASALTLQVAAIDLVRTEEGPLVIDVEPGFDLDPFEGATGKDMATAIFAHLEARAGRKYG